MDILYIRRPSHGIVIWLDEYAAGNPDVLLALDELDESGALGGFWGSLWSGIKKVGKAIARIVKIAKDKIDELLDWVGKQGKKFLQEGACIRDQRCNTLHILVDADRGGAHFRQASESECATRVKIDSSKVPGWITPTTCRGPQAPPAGTPQQRRLPPGFLPEEKSSIPSWLIPTVGIAGLLGVGLLLGKQRTVYQDRRLKPRRSAR